MLNSIKEGVTKNIIPLMLCVAIVTSCMYVYSKSYVIMLLIITFFIQASVFTFYNFLSKKSNLLKFISVVGSFMAICGLSVIAVKTGQNKSSLDFFVWFLSPQALVEFSVSYIVAIFIIINFFIASTVYYFSVVRYRISISFMITLIPFAFYRKEGEQVPVFFALILLILYVALMIHCRQLDKKNNEKIIIDNGYKKSVTYFLTFSALVALVLPKPDIKLNNDWMDTLLESDALTSYMLSKLGLESDTATSSETYVGASDVRLFEFVTDEEPINLKSQTYSIYDYEKNMWHVDDSDIRGVQLSETDSELLNPEKFYSAVAIASEADNKFAEKYNIEGIKKRLEEDYLRILILQDSAIRTKYYLSPTLTYSVISNVGDYVYKAKNGMIYSASAYDESYKIKYFSPKSAEEEDYQKILDSLSREKYYEFLYDLYDVLNASGENKYLSVVNAYITDAQAAAEYEEKFRKDLPENITSLSDEIIGNASSDLKKAMRIESYFRINDYKYSLSYKKPSGYNMEYFLFEGKTGICSDYATAMVLLARSAGIPARYTEGVHLHRDSDDDLTITVTDSDLHAFPELFIPGYGWMTFEPTQIEQAGSKENQDYIMMLIVAFSTTFIIVFVILFSKFVYPQITEYIFKFRVSKSAPEKSISMLMSKIRKLVNLDESATSSEISHRVISIYQIDISGFSHEFDTTVYGNKKLSEQYIDESLKLYTELYKKIQENKKIMKIEGRSGYDI